MQTPQKIFRPFGSAGPNPRTRRVKKSWSLVCHLRTYDWRCHFTLIRVVGGRRYLGPAQISDARPQLITTTAATTTNTNHQPPTTNHNPKTQNLCALTCRGKLGTATNEKVPYVYVNVYVYVCMYIWQFLICCCSQLPTPS